MYATVVHSFDIPNYDSSLQSDSTPILVTASHFGFTQSGGRTASELSNETCERDKLTYVRTVTYLLTYYIFLRSYVCYLASRTYVIRIIEILTPIVFRWLSTVDNGKVQGLPSSLSLLKTGVPDHTAIFLHVDVVSFHSDFTNFATTFL